MKPNDLSELIDLLRAKGISIYKDADVELVLGRLPSSSTNAELKPAADECPCGHPVLQHSASGCLFGCSVDSCEPHLHPKQEE